MPHRDAHPGDLVDFDPGDLPVLRRAVEELSWLLERGYAPGSSATLVGDRHQLRRRQRLAVMRCAEGRTRAAERLERELRPGDWAGRTVAIDAFNVIVTVESALAGSIVLIGVDGCYRDLASVHGTYRRVEETDDAIDAVGETLAREGVVGARWLIDRPVSNSGRVAAMLRGRAAARGWRWSAELVASADGVLVRETASAVATSDSKVLDRCGPWLNLAGRVIAERVPGAWIVDLRP